MRLFASALVTIAVVAGSAPTWAVGCGDDVRAFAASRGITQPAPRATPGDRSGSVTSEDLARSGGVVAPAEQPPTRVITPPPSGDSMATTPPVDPHTQQGRTGDSSEAAAAKRTQVAALVDAALAADARGDQAACEGALARARSVAQAD